MIRMLLVAAPCALAGLACATPYGPKGLGGGYSEAPLQHPDEWWLEVSGNGFSDRALLLGYWHRRAKELCGHDQYKATLDTERSDFDLGTDIKTTSSARGNSQWARGESHTSVTNRGTVAKYSVVGIVQCGASPTVLPTTESIQLTPPVPPRADGCHSDADCKFGRRCDQSSSRCVPAVENSPFPE